MLRLEQFLAQEVISGAVILVREMRVFKSGGPGRETEHLIVRVLNRIGLVKLMLDELKRVLPPLGRPKGDMALGPELGQYAGTVAQLGRVVRLRELEVPSLPFGLVQVLHRFLNTFLQRELAGVHLLRVAAQAILRSLERLVHP